MGRKRTHKRLWMSSGGFQWASSAGHMIPDGCYWNADSTMNIIDTDCPWSELNAIFRLTGFRPNEVQSSDRPFDEDDEGESE
ncbi:MAG: hypothetical protein JSV16_09045 [Candidatus Hydrogenedentota bacterium]|nr:MAG: hypothetical protein JSV16_09045 [Candidatus Hydrogenedentota bacterium]